MNASMIEIALKMTAALGVVLVVFAAAVFVARKASIFGASRKSRGAPKRSEIDVVGMRSIAPGNQLLVVSVEGKRYLLGTTQQQISKLADLEDELDDETAMETNFSDSLNDSETKDESLGSQIRSRLGAITRV
jgi:flagellar biogenesis protein FliO